MSARKHIQRLEAAWRQRGLLVHADPSRDGIWIFQGSSESSHKVPYKGPGPLTVVEIQASGLQRKDKGIYEPTNLARSKQNSLNTANTSSSSASPSSSLENALRNAQVLNSRSIQNNNALNVMQELPTSPGMKSVTGSDITPSLKDLHEYFISSVLGSIVYFLCHDHDFIPLNSRTLVLNPIISERSKVQNHGTCQTLNAIELATLDISLTSLGTLIVKGHSDLVPGLQSLISNSNPGNLLENLSPGVALWLAPGGNAAKLHSIPDDLKTHGSLPLSELQSSSTDQKPNGFNVLSVKSWQSRCLDWLSTKGLNSAALESGGWLLVQVSSDQFPYMKSDLPNNAIFEDLAIVPWPALLCFQTSNLSYRNSQLSDAALTVRDPLAFAEEWFVSNDERAKAIVKRQKDRQAQVAEALSRELAEAEARTLQSNIYSPAALRRGSNAGAMYPTPPDAPQHPVGATPSFDGNVSTPGNPNPFAAPETALALGPISSAADADIWNASGRKDRLNPGINFADAENENDNLFGDLGGDLFGADITDADFSFFDEPDPIQIDQKSDSPTAVSLEATQDSLVKAVTPPRPPLDAVMLDSNHVSENPNIDRIAVTAGKRNDMEISDSKKGGGVGQKFIDPQPPLPPSIPFNKELVFQKLSQHQRENPANKPSRRAGLFNKIIFESSLLSVNEKYNAHGQFRVSKERKATKVDSGIPRTQYLESRKKIHESRPNIPNLAHSISKEKIAEDSKMNDPMEFLMDSDSASQVSEQDDTSRTTENSSPILPIFGSKRKWDFEEGDDVSSSFNALAMDFEQPASTPQSISSSQLPFLEADPADWSLATYLISPEPDVQSTALSDVELIATAQILADQAASSTLRLLPASGAEKNVQLNNNSATRKLVYSLTEAVNPCLQDANVCTLRCFSEIQGLTVLAEGLRLPPRPNQNPRVVTTDTPKAINIFPIPPPQLEIRRSDAKLTVLPAAVRFWEILGLGPSKGPKDIHAVCVFPNLEGVATNANIFLNQMRSAYESSRLGCHERVIGKDITDGLLHFSLDPRQQNTLHYLAVLKETAIRLSKILSSMDVDGKNFIVYFVYPIDNKALLVNICSAFQHLFNLYRKALSDHRLNPTNELVLQLVPLDFVASPTSMAVPPPTDYFRLAMEVYDRCIDFTSSSSTPAIMLEQPLPRSIDFKLIPNPSVALLQENTCLHVAYAQSIDDRWVAAAWTDNRGTQQMTASYCLGRKNEPISMPFFEIANEIWQTTLYFISCKKIHWRIILARVGVMDPSEIELWTSLAARESNAQISLTLITVQTDPSLSLLPPSITLSPNGGGVQPIITPVSTPQNLQSSIMSPETATTPTRENPTVATPSETPVEPDNEARLLDYTDQSWGALLSHRLNNSNSLMDLNLALISGYLIKRGGTNSDDPPVIMEVNIVQSEVAGNPRTFHESLLREILGYYRGLGTLARVRGTVDTVRDVRPWHIAASEKAVKTLYMMM